MAGVEGIGASHLTAEQVAAYLERVVSAAERNAIEAHLSACDTCRSEVVEVARLRRTPRWGRWYIWTPVAAAAAVILFLVAGPQVGAPGPEIVRRGDRPSEGTPRFEVLAPMADRPVAPDSVLFLWRAPATDAHYRLTVTDMSGGTVYSETSPDTALLLMDSAALLPDQAYFWYVDALLADGSTATTGVQRFSTRP
jgi:hypothetical protein